MIGSPKRSSGQPGHKAFELVGSKPRRSIDWGQHTSLGTRGCDWPVPCGNWARRPRPGAEAQLPTTPNNRLADALGYAGSSQMAVGGWVAMVWGRGRVLGVAWGCEGALGCKDEGV